MLFAHYTTNYSQAKMLIKHLTNKGIKCHIAKDDRWYVVLADFDAECHVCITIEDKFEIECDYNFGQVMECDDDFGFYDLPCVFSDFSNASEFHEEYVGGHFKKSEQLKAFGVYFGRMLIRVDFKNRCIVLIRSVCFGTDCVSTVYPFSDLPKLKSGEMNLVEF